MNVPELQWPCSRTAQIWRQAQPAPYSAIAAKTKTGMDDKQKTETKQKNSGLAVYAEGLPYQYLVYCMTILSLLPF